MKTLKGFIIGSVLVLGAVLLLRFPTTAQPPGGPGAPVGPISDLSNLPPTWSQILPADDGEPDGCNSTRFECILPDDSVPPVFQAVLDHETGLVWHRFPDNTVLQLWGSAVSGCWNINVGGRLGWRLATIEELFSLVDRAQSNPALPLGHPFVFSVALTSDVWSATTTPSAPTQAQTLGVGDGFLGGASKTAPNHWRWCVRGGQGATEDNLLPLELSSGLFGLPANAVSVDWMVVNNSGVSQTITVTVFRAVGGAKIIVGAPLTLTVAPGEVTHDANSVGVGQPFVPGFYYEVVVDTADPNVLPSVHVWQDSANTVIPGTLIPPGSWVRLE